MRWLICALIAAALAEDASPLRSAHAAEPQDDAPLLRSPAIDPFAVRLPAVRQTSLDPVWQWRQLAERLKDASETEKLKEVNRFFNRLLFASDRAIWGQKDYWATPAEFLSRRAGDCEDFAISKYFTLRALGVPDDKLYLTYVRATELNRAHMVLTYFSTPAATPLVLDNLISEIKPADRRRDLTPIYSFNGSGVWRALHNHRKGRHLGPSRRLHQWHALLARVQRKNGL